MKNIALLAHASKVGDLEQVKRAVETEQTDPNSDLTQGKLGWLSDYTPTILKGVWSGSRDNLGYRALHWAARKGHKEIIEYLCTHGANFGQYVAC